MRLSDAERTDAMNQLARAVGEGRITMDEFEERSDDIMRAATRRDLVPLFSDIPARGTQELKVYSQGDLERARAAARKPRLATALIGTIGLNVAAISVGVAGTGAGAAVGVVTLLALVPVLWILLYVAKVGPESWSTPSARQVERQRMREIQQATAAQRAEQKAIESQMWAQRRQQASELTGEAMNFAKKKFNQWNEK
ncbi:MAG TPA: DUF1707 domain-containing protein [Corynebacterium phoceense]|nr:DUF1707 domain-containing protein [Corynebacterium phoceense]HJG42873.1 DUF1707 domain-containing protein [Corynebacterium phoceense]